MKDWKEYECNEHPPHRRLRDSYLQSLTENINNTRLTRCEYDSAISDAKKDADDWYNRKVREYNKELIDKYEEFLRDCRAELGYDKNLSDKGRAILEDNAQINGTSIEEIYNILKSYVKEKEMK